MISNARGKHSSPGVYIEEIDKSYATKSLGITTLGVVGETLKGPAFEPVRISDWSEFQDYFGGTSTEKFIGTGYPKYELPYIAKSYLQESKQLEVCRVLGFSGYNAGPAYVIYGTGDGEDSEKYVIAVLRSKGTYNAIESDNDKCTGKPMESLTYYATGVTMEPYTSLEVIINCSGTTSTATTDESVNVNNTGNYGKFTLKITKQDGSIENVPVSLIPGDKDYIINVLGMSASDGDYALFVEELYDMAHMKACNDNVYTKLNIKKVEGEFVSNYLSPYNYASTPWFVSELKGSGTNVEMKKLFRFHTISDGNAANTQIKISIANILPEEGYFDVLIRDFNDSDASPIILERYNKCTMVPGQANYIGLKIGTFNGEYANKSKYVTVEVIENDMTENCVPCGFLGYPLSIYGTYKSTYQKGEDTTEVESEADKDENGNAIVIKTVYEQEYKTPELEYNTKYYDTYKANRQYFGMSDIVGVDADILSFKGVNAYNEKIFTSTEGYSNGFHLDALLSKDIKPAEGETGTTITYTVDGATGYTFTTVSPKVSEDYDKLPRIGSDDVMEGTIYEEVKMRKFTCYPYGGFDGWDIYREERTNTGKYRANKYKATINAGDTFTTLSDAYAYGITGKAITSDYYAYLAGYKQFDNPNKIKINLLATPGIDYVNNLDLVNDVLDIVEESRQGDCLYIVTTPDADTEKYPIEAEDAVANFDSSEISTSYAATYYPWVKYYDATNKKYINLPVTKDVVRNFAHTDNVAHPWFASAGMSRGNVDCVKASHFTKLEEEDMLYEGMINPVKSFGADGVKIWGNKTMYREDTPLNRINVRRLMIRVKDLVMNAARQLIFEQNDNTIEAQFRSIVDPILANAKQNRGISDYKIKTDVSAEARDRKELPAAIYVKPINCLEYIPITFTIYPEGAKFDE